MPHDDNNGNDWEGFDWQAWGEDPTEDTAGHNGHNSKASTPRQGDLSRLTSLDGVELYQDEPEINTIPGATESGHWVRQGGVLSWESEGDEADAPTNPRDEAASVWADDEMDVPPGAPDHLRVRATHAWLARQRALEEQALGALLLERRRLYAGDAGNLEESQEEHNINAAEAEDAPLNVALAEHQAALEAYDQMLEMLDDFTAHTGPKAVLVEFYLWLTEELARLAAAPEAPADFASRLLLVPVESEEAVTGADTSRVTPRSLANWQGRAEATVQARKRVERVTALDPED